MTYQVRHAPPPLAQASANLTAAKNSRKTTLDDGSLVMVRKDYSSFRCSQQNSCLELTGCFRLMMASLACCKVLFRFMGECHVQSHHHPLVCLLAARLQTRLCKVKAPRPPSRREPWWSAATIKHTLGALKSTISSRQRHHIK